MNSCRKAYLENDCPNTPEIEGNTARSHTEQPKVFSASSDAIASGVWVRARVRVRVRVHISVR
eukprot:10927221-Alexandrium_andersonii.AAC.1